MDRAAEKRVFTTRCAGVGVQIGERLYTKVYYNADFGYTNHVISSSATYR